MAVDVPTSAVSLDALLSNSTYGPMEGPLVSATITIDASVFSVPQMDLKGSINLAGGGAGGDPPAPDLAPPEEPPEEEEKKKKCCGGGKKSCGGAKKDAKKCKVKFGAKLNTGAFKDNPQNITYSEQEVEQGQDAVPYVPTDSDREMYALAGMMFVETTGYDGWDKDYRQIKADTDIKAKLVPIAGRAEPQKRGLFKNVLRDSEKDYTPGELLIRKFQMDVIDLINSVKTTGGDIDYCMDYFSYILEQFNGKKDTCKDLNKYTVYIYYLRNILSTFMFHRRSIILEKFPAMINVYRDNRDALVKIEEDGDLEFLNKRITDLRSEVDVIFNDLTDDRNEVITEFLVETNKTIDKIQEIFSPPVPITKLYSTKVKENG